MPDVLLSSTGDLPTHCYLTSGSALVRQRVEIRLRTMLGEWFLDQYVGLPWAEWFGSKGTSPAVISARVRTEVAETPGVQEVTAWNYTSTRQGVITMEGEFLVSTEEESTAVIPVRVSLVPGNASPWVIWMR